MKNQLFNKRIPTILGIGLVILGVILTSVVVKIQTSLRSKASNSQKPQNVKVTNLSDNSFTITYQTDAAATGSINYGKRKELGNTELDDLDKEKGDFSPKNIHSISVKKLSPNTEYFLVIISGENTFLNNGVPFRIETGPNISSPSALQSKIKGKVVLPDGNPPIDAIVYLSSDNSQLLSTVVGKNGEFNFSLKQLRSEDLGSYFKSDENTSFKLEAIGKSLKSTVSTSLNNLDSIPTITLSNDYDFTDTSIPVASKSAQSGFPSISIKSGKSKPQILTPKKDQEFTDQQPQFRGTALPNEKVQIIIRSPQDLKTEVIADSNGNWTYRPPTALSPGQHTITILTRDASGILTTLTQSFTVFAESTTPSATPAIKITPTSTPTPTITPTPSLSPTITSSPTPSPTLIPTVAITPFPSPISTIETKGGLSPTGSSQILIVIGGIVATMTGIVLFLLTRTIL